MDVALALIAVEFQTLMPLIPECRAFVSALSMSAGRKPAAGIGIIEDYGEGGIKYGKQIP